MNVKKRNKCKREKIHVENEKQRRSTLVDTIYILNRLKFQVLTRFSHTITAPFLFLSLSRLAELFFCCLLLQTLIICRTCLTLKMLSICFEQNLCVCDQCEIQLCNNV